MKPIVGRFLTHAVAIALGVLAAALIGGAIASQRTAGGPSAENPEAAASAGDATPERTGRPLRLKTTGRDPSQKARLSSREFRLAWDAIGRRDVTSKERIRLQQEVLKQWAEVDLEAALKAALESPWDEGNNVDQLLNAFNEAFAKDPIGAWDLINSGKLGLGASLVRTQWAEAVAREHPSLVLSYLPQLPANGRKQILMTLASYANTDPVKREEFLNKLCDFPEDEQFMDWIKTLVPILQAGERAGVSELREKLAAATTPQRTTLYLHQLGLALKNADMATIRDEWGKIPPELQGRAIRSVTLHSDAAKNTPELFDMLAKADQWDFMNTEKWRLNRYAQANGKQEELAKWALTLPENPKSQEIFHRSVEPFINADLDKAGDWIETLPPGWQRDRALAELSQRSIWGKQNTEISDWALNEISDPKLKADATRWRGDWARQTGRNP